MPRTIPSVPNPTVDLIEADAKTPVASRVWFRWFSDLYAALVNRIPVSSTVTFTAGATKAVVFTTAEADANYSITYSSPEDNFLWTTSKTTAGFVANAKNSSSATFNWTLIRS